ncbi:MAG: 6-carboxytetrahydropterin synthase QueD [Clostridiales bacterium]|nr:6-carboxytetrahydropterin synthase QueD [Clostridiales bacterium]
MYTIRTEQSFDSAHFLARYEGKCSNLHGHRWRVIVEICAEALSAEGQNRGMVADFGDLKRDLKELAEAHDHAFLYEKGTLRKNTEQALKEEGFLLIDLPFRPTAENFAKYFFDLMTRKGYPVCAVEVYETPNNCARYTADRRENL